jgi:hypothetical protein
VGPLSFGRWPSTRGQGGRDLRQHGYDQHGYDQAGYNQPGYDQPGHDQPGHDQPGDDRPGYELPTQTVFRLQNALIPSPDNSRP